MAKGPPEQPHKKAGHSRQEKLAEVLRANLRKRKDQARLRSAESEPKKPVNPDPPKPEDS